MFLLRAYQPSLCVYSGQYLCKRAISLTQRKETNMGRGYGCFLLARVPVQVSCVVHWVLLGRSSWFILFFLQDRYHHIFAEVEDTTDYFPEFSDIPSKWVAFVETTTASNCCSMTNVFSAATEHGYSEKKPRNNNNNNKSSAAVWHNTLWFVALFSITWMSCKSFDDYRRRITAYGCQNGTIVAAFVDTETKGVCEFVRGFLKLSFKNIDNDDDQIVLYALPNVAGVIKSPGTCVVPFPCLCSAAWILTTAMHMCSRTLAFSFLLTLFHMLSLKLIRFDDSVLSDTYIHR